MNILCVTGNRDWTCTETIRQALRELLSPDPRRWIVVHGGNGRLNAKVPHGLDVLAGAIAGDLGADVRAYPVDVALDGPWPDAGRTRNVRMVDAAGPHLGCAFGRLWRSPTRVTGTGHCTRLLLSRRIPTLWVSAPGERHVLLPRMPAPPGGR